MGRDKGLLPVDGVPMAVRVEMALRAAGAAEVVAVGGDAPALTALGLTVVADDMSLLGPGPDASSTPSAPSRGRGASGPPSTEPVPDDQSTVIGASSQGPLVGVVTALGALDTEVVLVVACDLVEPSAEAMAGTVAALQVAPAHDLAVPDDDGERPQWLHAAWRRGVRPRLVDALAAGERSVHGAVARAGLRVTTVTGLAPEVLADADTPGQLPRRSD